jgi:hypothetical protein
MGIVTDLEGFWSALTDRGIVVLLMAVAAASAALIHRRSQKLLSESLSRENIPLLRSLLLKSWVGFQSFFHGHGIHGRTRKGF